MNPLPLTFDKLGWHHEQVCRTQKIAIYRRWKDASSKPHYEVIEIGEFKESELHGSKIEAHEYYPGASSFGSKGWTYPTLEKAQAKYAELTRVVPKKVIKKIL